MTVKNPTRGPDLMEERLNLLREAEDKQVSTYRRRVLKVPSALKIIKGEWRGLTLHQVFFYVAHLFSLLQHYNNPINLALLLSHFTDEETEVQGD